MKHIFKQGSNANGITLLVLHGTGGDERDLLELAEEIGIQNNILSVRGNVVENGMNRFFKRLRPGVFDIVSLKKETEHLYEFLLSAAKTYNFDVNKVGLLGYSNGANIALNLIYTYGKQFLGAILFHPMNPDKEAVIPDLENVSIFISAGKVDPMTPYQEAVELENLLKAKRANVILHTTQAGHNLLLEEILTAKEFFLANLSI